MYTTPIAPNGPAYVKPKDGPVEIVVIADRSGSMDSIIGDAIGGFNTFLKEQQDQPGEANLTLVMFDTAYEVPVEKTELARVLPLTRETYVPRGGTALNDAIGRTLTKLKFENPEKAIICIITDGQENSSREYTTQQAKALIEECQGKGYRVLYLAANQDAFAVGATYGVNRQFVANFAFSGAGVRDAYASASLTSSNYRSGQVDAVLPPVLGKVDATAGSHSVQSGTSTP